MQPVERPRFQYEIPLQPVFNIDAFSQKIGTLNDQNYRSILKHDVTACMGDITGLARVLTFPKEAPVYRTGEEKQFIREALPYIQEVCGCLDNPEVLDKFKGTGGDVLYREAMDLRETVPVLLNSTLCLLNPTEERFTALYNSYISFHTLARRTDCDTKLLSKNPLLLNGVFGTVALQYLRNTLLYKKPDTVARAYLHPLNNKMLIIENISLKNVEAHHKQPGVSGGGSTGVGLTLVDAFAAAIGLETELSSTPKDEEFIIRAMIGL